MTYGKSYKIKINFKSYDDELAFRQKINSVLRQYMSEKDAEISFEEEEE